MRKVIISALFTIVCGSGIARAQVTLTASDPSGSSSFNTAGNWSNGQAPSSSFTYLDSSFQLRTPATSGSFTFQGISLELGSGADLAYKGIGSGTDVITVGNLIIDGSGAVQNNQTQTFTLAGGVTLNGGTPAFNTSNNGNIIVSANIAGTAGTLLVENNGGVANTESVTFTGSNSYSASTRISASGVLIVGANNTLPTGGAVILGDSSNTAGTLQLGTTSSAFNQTLASLTVSGTGAAAVVGGNSSSSVLTLNTSSGDTYAGVLGGAGTNQNHLALVKMGAATLTLSNSNSYTGSTTISAGTLLLSGTGSINNSRVINVQNSATLATSGSYSISSGQTLTGGGTVSLNSGGSALNILSGGTLSPSSLTLAPTTLAVTGSLTLGGTTDLSIYNGTTDAVIVSRMLTNGGVLTVSLSGSLVLNTYTLFTAGSFAGDFSTGDVIVDGRTLTDNSGVWTGTGGQGEQITYYANNNGASNGTLVLSAAPEPSEWALLGLGLVGVAILRRRSIRNLAP